MKVTEKGFLCCPECSGKTKTKVIVETELKRYPLFCPWCKKEFIIDYPARA